MKRRRLRRYVETVAAEMGLHGWTWKISRDPAGTSEYANIACVYGQRHAVIAVSAEWDTLDAETQRATVVHELLHAHLAPIRQLLEDVHEGDENVTKAFALLEEYTVEAIAQAWAPAVSLPEEKK